MTRASVTKVWSGYIGGVINSRLRVEKVCIYMEGGLRVHAPLSEHCKWFGVG